MRRQLVAALAPVLALVVVGAVACGDAADEPVAIGTVPNTATVPTPTSAPPTTLLPSAAGKPCVAATDVPPAEGKPTVAVPEGPPPTELVKTDLKVGDGAEAQADSTVKVQYVGIACSSGKQFDASWDGGGEPFEVTLGQGQVIPGWDQGIPGMKVGGQRMLVIPPALGYGSSGQGTDIAPDETLVFVVDLVEVVPPGASTTTTAAGAPPVESTTTTAAGAPPASTP